MRPEPSQKVLDWVAGQARTQIFTTTISQAEILYSLALLPEGRRQTSLTNAADQMFAEDFAGQIISFDGSVAEAFAAIAASRRRIGLPIQPFDGQIVSIAVANGAALATRNVADF